MPANDGTLINAPAPLINLSLYSAVPPATPSPNDIQIQCRGRQFGTRLDYGSCLDAFRTFPYGHSDAPVLIGRRGHGPYVRKLPWRLVSGDGRCVFDIVLKGTALQETTTGQEIARAAWKLVNECVRDQGGQGGVVSNIGMLSQTSSVLSDFTLAHI
ncbi:MAG: hypothetical protein Q9181_004827 [Wetmoreana brouardii]